MTRARAVAAAQSIPVRGDVDANIDRHLRLARIAGAAGAQVLVFPELSLTGYEIELAGELAFSSRDRRIDPLVDVASELSMTIIAGAPVRVGPRLHVGAFIIGPDGSIELYTKHRLGAFSSSAACDGIVPPAEATVFEPGEMDPLVRFDGHVAAVAICADVGLASHPQRAAERGADTYLASMFVIPSEYEQETAHLKSYAARHAMAVVLANYGGPSGGLNSAGGSAIWTERGDLLGRLDASGAGLLVAVEDQKGWRTRRIMAETV